jgi:hypothetical protein
MTRRTGGRVHAFHVSRPIRLALIVPIAGLALLASQSGLRPSSASAAVCQSGPYGTAVFYNPPFLSGSINGAGCGNVVVFDFGHSGTISGATLYGAQDEGANGDGDGVKLVGAGTVTIKNTTIRNNVDSGIDAFNDGTNLKMSNDVINANGGNGVTVADGAKATVDHTTVTNSTGTGPDSGGFGFNVEFSGVVTITSSTISDNSNAGVDAESSSSVTMTADTLANNASDGVRSLESTVTMDSTSISYSTSGPAGDGDGVNSEDSTMTISRSVVSYNDDEGVDAYDGTNLTMRNDNVSHNHGNGVYLTGSTTDATILSSFINNTTTKHSPSADGDGVLVDDGIDSLYLAGSQMNANDDDGVDIRGGKTAPPSIQSSKIVLPQYYLKADVMKGNGDNGLYVEFAPVTASASVFLLNDNGVYLDSEATANLTAPVVQQNHEVGIYVFTEGLGLTLTNGFVQFNDTGVYKRDSGLTISRSVLCKNTTTDLNFNGSVAVDGRTLICHHVP